MPDFRYTKWFHSTVVTTDDGAPRYPLDVPIVLTTVWTPPDPVCSERWKLSLSSTFDIFQFNSDGTLVSDQLQTVDFIAFSTIPLPPGSITRSSSDDSPEASLYAHDNVASGCQPYSNKWYYSPGVCPESHTVAEMTAFRNTIESVIETHYLASCCRRFVCISLTAFPRFIS